MEDQLQIFKEAKVFKKTNFSDWQILGHKPQIDYLKSNIKTHDLSHAYLFSGEENIGKRKVALSFIKTLLCVSDLKFCGKCPACLQIENKTHPDFLFIDGEKSIKIEEVRELVAKMNLKPFSSSYKIAVIDNAERLTKEAANALLKTLEEPSGKAVLVLITKNHSLLLPTIVSRLRVLKFFRVSLKIIEKITNKANISKEEQILLSKFAAGRPGIVFKMLENPEELKEIKSWLLDFSRIFKKDRVSNLNYSSRLAKVYENDPLKVLKILNFWVILLRELINAHFLPGFKSLVSYDLSKLKVSQISNIVSFINKTKEIISTPDSGLNIKLVLDLMILKLEEL